MDKMKDIIKEEKSKHVKEENMQEIKSGVKTKVKEPCL